MQGLEEPPRQEWPWPRWGVPVGLAVLAVGPARDPGHVSGCGCCLAQHLLYGLYAVQSLLEAGTVSTLPPMVPQ